MRYRLLKVIVEELESSTAPTFREAHLCHVLEMLLINDNITTPSRSTGCSRIDKVSEESLGYGTAVT